MLMSICPFPLSATFPRTDDDLIFLFIIYQKLNLPRVKISFPYHYLGYPGMVIKAMIRRVGIPVGNADFRNTDINFKFLFLHRIISSLIYSPYSDSHIVAVISFCIHSDNALKSLDTFYILHSCDVIYA